MRRIIAREFLLAVLCLTLSALVYYPQSGRHLVHQVHELRSNAQTLLDKKRRFISEYNDVSYPSAEWEAIERRVVAIQSEEHRFWNKAAALERSLEQRKHGANAWKLMPIALYPGRFFVLALVWSCRVIREKPSEEDVNGDSP